MTVPLTEFSIVQLGYMLEIARERRKEARATLDELSAMFEEVNEARAWKERYQEFDDYLFIETQLLNALSEVLEREKIIAS